MTADDFSKSLPQGGNWKPVKDIDGDGAKLYIQKGSKMNDGEFDEMKHHFRNKIAAQFYSNILLQCNCHFFLKKIRQSREISY